MTRPGKVLFVVVALAGGVFAGFIVWGAGRTLSPSESRFLRSTLAPKANKHEFRLVTYNVGYASGMKNNDSLATEEETRANLQTMKDFLKNTQADFVGLQEVDLFSHRSHNINQVDFLSDGLFAVVAVFVNWDKRYVPYPYFKFRDHFGRVNSGQAILSHYSMKMLDDLVFEKPRSSPFWRNWFYLDRAAIFAEVEVEGGGSLVIGSVHLEAFDRKAREQQAEKLAAYVKQFEGRPFILSGDFNADPMYKEDKTLEILLQTGFLQNAYTPFIDSRPWTQFATYPANDPKEFIDHILVNSWIKVNAFRVHQDQTTASDHVPVSMDFSLKDLH